MPVLLGRGDRLGGRKDCSMAVNGILWTMNNEQSQQKQSIAHFVGSSECTITLGLGRSDTLSAIALWQSISHQQLN